MLVDAEAQRARRRGQRQPVPAASWPGQMRTVWGDHGRFFETYFTTYPRPLFHRRRLPPRRGRLLLDHRPGRRRHQRLRPPHRHAPRSKARSSRTPRSPRRRSSAIPHDIKGQAIYAFVTLNAGEEGERRAAQGAGPGSAPRHRRARRAREDPVHAGAAQDPLGQDHAPHPAQDRRGRDRAASATPRRWPIRRVVDALLAGRQ